MIYNDEFVWLHFPKCAGTKVEQLFSEYLSDQEDLHLDLVGSLKDPTIAWHDTIAKREARDPEFRLGDRTVICSVRKLHTWLVSRFCYEVRRSPNLDHNPETLLEGKFLEAKGYLNNADWYMKQYLPKDILSSGNVRFIRTEFFEEDFKRVFGEYLDLSSIPDEVYRKKTKNKSEDCIPKKLKDKFLASEENLYKHCRYWKNVEELVYV